MHPTQHLRLFIALFIAHWCVFAPAASAQAAVRCGPQPASLVCNPTPECEGIIRKVHSPGCSNKNGKLLLDGGCQCKGYCGYKCAGACQADPECRWDKSKKKCFNIATGKAGQPLKICAATNSPVVTSSPTSIPTSSPTPQPPTSSPTPEPPTLKPTHQPTDAPIQSTKKPTGAPTPKSICKLDSKFPGRTFDPYVTQTLAVSPNGNVVLFAEVTWKWEDDDEHDPNEDDPYGQGTPVTTVWITKKTGNKWEPKQVSQYTNTTTLSVDASASSAAMSSDGTHVVFYLVPHEPEKNEDTYSDKLQLTFLKLKSNDEYEVLNTFNFENAFGVIPNFWMSSNGDTTIVSYIADAAEPDVSTPKTKTYIRERNTWRLERTQDDLFLQIYSRDGKTAYTEKSIYVLQNKDWVLLQSGLAGSGGVQPEYQGTIFSKFSANGKIFVMGSAVEQHLPEYDQILDDSGAFVFVRSNNNKGNFTQQGSKVGGGNVREGRFTGISDDLKTIMLSDGSGRMGGGFKLFKKNRNAKWEQAGPVVQTDAYGSVLNNKGNKVTTIWPPSVWTCAE